MKHGFKTLLTALVLGLCITARAGAQDSASDLSASADAKAQNGDYDGAIADYNRAIAADPKFADAYNGRGFVKQQKNDFAGALADFNKTIELDPNNALAYSYRSYVKVYSGDSDGAIADANRSIELDPTNSESFRVRGVARQYKDDLDGAISDFAKALKIDPKYALVYDCMGFARQSKGDADGAMADMGRAATLAPDDPVSYLYRGSEKYMLGKWADAVADFRHTCELPPTNGGDLYQDYARLWLWMARARLGETDAATKELADALAKRRQAEPNLWASKVGDYFLGTITDDDLLTASAAAYKLPDPDQKCEALFYTGIKKLVAGDKESAADYFQKCIATERRGAAEYVMAEAELKEISN